MPPTTSSERLVPPCGDPADRSQDVLGGGPLDEVADAPGAEHLEDRRTILERGERDHAGAGGQPLDLPRGPGAAARGHLDVEQRDVGLLPLREGDRLVRVGGRPHEEDPLLLGEELGQGPAQGWLIVGHQDADALGRRGHGRFCEGEAPHDVRTVPTGDAPCNRPGAWTGYPPSVPPSDRGWLPEVPSGGGRTPIPRGGSPS